MQRALVNPGSYIVFNENKNNISASEMQHFFFGAAISPYGQSHPSYYCMTLSRKKCVRLLFQQKKEPHRAAFMP